MAKSRRSSCYAGKREERGFSFKAKDRVFSKVALLCHLYLEARPSTDSIVVQHLELSGSLLWAWQSCLGRWETGLSCCAGGLGTGQACELSEIELEIAIAKCLNMMCKPAQCFRFHSDRDQPDRICHSLATSPEAFQMNIQHFICWLSAVTAPPDIAMTFAASLEELGLVDSATAQYEHLVTTLEGSL